MEFIHVSKSWLPTKYANNPLIVLLFISIGLGIKCYECQITLLNIFPDCLTKENVFGPLKECSEDIGVDSHQNVCFSLRGGILSI